MLEHFSYSVACALVTLVCDTARLVQPVPFMSLLSEVVRTASSIFDDEGVPSLQPPEIRTDEIDRAKTCESRATFGFFPAIPFPTGSIRCGVLLVCRLFCGRGEAFLSPRLVRGNEA